MTPRPALLLAALLLAAPLVPAQWSVDPATNLSLADGAGAQIQPKVVPGPDGGCWVSWFGDSGYDVRVQRLDAGGVEQLPHGGVLVADRGFSSTQDYGLAVASDGAALLAFRDDSVGGTQISAARVLPDGSLAWGAGNVQLTATAAFVAAPSVAAGPSGGAYVSWTQDADVHVQLLDASGAAQWVGDTVFTPAVGTYSVADSQASGNGVIVSFVLQTGGFGSPRHLYAQRLDDTGATTWPASHVKVFDGGSLQFGNFPDFEPDGSGGAVFSWYDVAVLGQFQCYVQHVLADGTEAFGHNGSAVSTAATRQRVSPEVSFDPASGETLAAWVETDANQVQQAVGAQRFDAAGNRLWGAAGKGLTALGADGIGDVRVQASGSDAFVVWRRAPAFGADVLEAARLDQGGTLRIPVFDVASTPSSKGRVQETLAGSGDVVLVWNDDGTGSDDVLGQNIRPDGSLGALWADLGGGTTGSAGDPTLTMSGPLTAASLVHLELVDGAPSALAVVFISFSSTPAPFLGGTLHTFPYDELVVVGTDGAGGLAGDAVFPGAPAGTQLWFQVGIADAGVPLYGASLSNGVVGTVP